MICRFLEKIWSRSWNDVSRLCCECYTVLSETHHVAKHQGAIFALFPAKKKSYLAREFWSSSSHSTWPIPANSSRKMNKKIYLPTTTYHYIIKQNFCCHCIVDIKLQSQILKNDDIPTVKYVRFIKCSSISSELNNNWDDISMCYKVQFLTTNNEDKYSNNASTFYY